MLKKLHRRKWSFCLFSQTSKHKAHCTNRRFIIHWGGFFVPLTICFEEGMWVIISKCYFLLCNSTVPASVSCPHSPMMTTCFFAADVKLLYYPFYCNILLGCFKYMLRGLPSLKRLGRAKDTLRYLLLGC